MKLPKDLIQIVMAAMATEKPLTPSDPFFTQI
jgi:hypothetical protein